MWKKGPKNKSIVFYLTRSQLFSVLSNMEGQWPMTVYHMLPLTCCNPLRKFPGWPASWTQGYFLCLNIWTKGMTWITGRTFFQGEVWNSSDGNVVRMKDQRKKNSDRFVIMRETSVSNHIIDTDRINSPFSFLFLRVPYDTSHRHPLSLRQTPNHWPGRNWSLCMTRCHQSLACRNISVRRKDLKKVKISETKRMSKFVQGFFE